MWICCFNKSNSFNQASLDETSYVSEGFKGASSPIGSKNLKNLLKSLPLNKLSYPLNIFNSLIISFLVERHENGGFSFCSGDVVGWVRAEDEDFSFFFQFFKLLQLVVVHNMTIGEGFGKLRVFRVCCFYLWGQTFLFLLVGFFSCEQHNYLVAAAFGKRIFKRYRVGYSAVHIQLSTDFNGLK